jgi:hypothetical protein
LVLFVLNPDNDLIPFFPDYTLILPFIRHKTEEGKEGTKSFINKSCLIPIYELNKKFNIFKAINIQ